MIERPVRLAGTALIWQAVQMGGVKGIYLIRLLILARMLTPEDFGLVAIAVTAMGFLLNVSNFGMVPALVQGEQTDDAQYNAAWTIGITRSFFITVMMIATASFIANIFAEPRSVAIIQVLALRPLLEALTSIKVAALNRNLRFRPLAIMNLIEALVNTVVSIAFAKVFGVWGLVAGALAGAVSDVITSYILAPHRPRLLFDREAIRPLIRFGRWIFISSLVTMAGSYVLRIVISRQLGAAGLGLYFLAAQLAFLPGEIVHEVVGNVAFPLFSRLQADIPQATRVYRALFSGLTAVLYPVCALMIVLAPTLTQELLGPRWSGTEPLIRILALVAMIGLFGEVAVPVIKGFGQPYRITLLEVVQSSVIIALVWILTNRFGLVGAALAWLPAITLSQFLSARFLQNILDHPFQGLQRPILAVLAVTGICAAIAAAVNNLLPGIIGFVAAGVSAVLVTAALLWTSDRRFELGFVRNLAWVFPQFAALIGLPVIEN